MKIKKTNRQNPIPRLVERGFAIHQQLVVLNEEFKQIKERLKMEAGSRPQERTPLLDKGSVGEQWVAKAADCECRIIFPASPLTTSFDPNEPRFTTIRTVAGKHFKALFRKVTTFEPRQKKNFRRHINSLLDKDDAKFLIELCSNLPEIKAVWKSRIGGKEQA